MKHINYLLNLFIISILLIAACTPIEDNIDLENSTTVEGVKLSATNTTAGGNEIILKMETPGVTGYWNYNLGTSLSNETTIVYPIPGKATFKFIGNLGAEFFEKTIDVTIDKLDHPVDKEWTFLVGTGTEGKTWVLAEDRPANKPPFTGNSVKTAPAFCFLADPNNFKAAWWNAGKTQLNDADAEMKFDLNGGVNYTYINAGEETKGSFVLDAKNEILDLDGANLVGAVVNGQFDNTQEGKYQLKIISENELVLFQIFMNKKNVKSGWTWVFKPKGYVYPK